MTSFLLTAPAVSPPIHNAITTLQRDLAELMQSHPDCYFPYDCDGSIGRLVDLTLGRHAALRTCPELEVVSLVPRDLQDLKIRAGQKNVAPKTGLAPNQSWQYHVILRAGERVYDFDYPGKPGIDVREYACALFGENLQDYDALFISAAEYSRLVPCADIRKTFFKGAWQRLPLSEFVATLSVRYPEPAPPYADLQDRITVFQKSNPIIARLLRFAPNLFVVAEILAPLNRARHEVLPWFKKILQEAPF